MDGQLGTRKVVLTASLSFFWRSAMRLCQPPLCRCDQGGPQSFRLTYPCQKIFYERVPPLVAVDDCVDDVAEASRFTGRVPFSIPSDVFVIMIGAFLSTIGTGCPPFP